MKKLLPPLPDMIAELIIVMSVVSYCYGVMTTHADTGIKLMCWSCWLLAYIAWRKSA